MTIGEKIKKARLALKLTQSDVSGNKLTRNMICAIENGKATPSIETLSYLAERLDLPLSYLLSGEDDLSFFRKKERIQLIKNALDEKNYTVCISHIMKLEKLDDELCYILSDCYFNLGIHAVKSGMLDSAVKYLSSCLLYCEKTIYDTRRFETVAPLYLSIAKNVNAPLLEFEENKFYEHLSMTVDYELYRYLVIDFDYPYTYFPYKTHIAAKQLIKERKYSEAIKLLLTIEETKSEYEYNSYVLYGVYTDLDNCYRSLFDFENAYRYSSKRISLLEGFKS